MANRQLLTLYLICVEAGSKHVTNTTLILRQGDTCVCFVGECLFRRRVLHNPRSPTDHVQAGVPLQIEPLVIENIF